MKGIRLLTSVIALTMCLDVWPQTDSLALERTIGNWFLNYSQPDYRPTLQPGLSRCMVDSVKKTLHLYGNEGFASQTFTPQMVEEIYESLRRIIPDTYRHWSLMVYGFDREISELVPNSLRKHPDESRQWGHHKYKGRPWVENTSRHTPTRGLEGHHLCIWPSHGKYYSHETGTWRWQRPRLLCTSEDLLTQSFVTPYLIPMLRNSGAIVWSPRELSWQRNEVIADNQATSYKETRGEKTWQTSPTPGYGHKDNYNGQENPFNQGNARLIETVRNANAQSTAVWTPSIPEEGHYPVYISYQTFTESTDDARYTVIHKGISTQFTVNQQMGGGTWVYLGTFSFSKGQNPDNCIILSNLSHTKGLVSADAIRIGGGMGNISRTNIPENNFSGLPRHMEGARYNLQLSGFPEQVYSTKDGLNDYADDINCRSHALNHLSGKSPYNPTKTGLGVPLELSLAIHSDAGKTHDGSTIGTLAIHTEKNSDGITQLSSGLPRMVSADLAGAVQLSVYNDLKHTLGHWTRRERFNRNYSETRLPEVPSAILEMLSHQNYQDMKLGHDPNFKFLMARAIYKGLLRFLETQHGENYIVHPLPVHAFQALLIGNNQARLRWQPTQDPLETSAKPDGYIVYTRKDGQDFDNGTYTKDPNLTISLQPDRIYSFKVTAVNRGGESLPSEILSVRQARQSQAEILIVNGFTRLSGPETIEKTDSIGFNMRDPGVSYMATPEYCGPQLNFDPTLTDSEGAGAYGYSSGEWEGKLMMGNTFDYPYVHGKSIEACGQFSFSSSSMEAVESGKVIINAYPVVDIIMGLQKDCGKSSIKPYKTFSKQLQQLLATYVNHGNLILTGSYVASDMTKADEIFFTTNILHYKSAGRQTVADGNTVRTNNIEMAFEREIGGSTYAVTQPDIIVPSNDAFTAFTYSDGTSAGIASVHSRGKTVVMGVPFESIKDPKQRHQLMAGFLKLFWP